MARCWGSSSGFPSRRLIGDYLAIVTLFFGEAFVEFTNNVAPTKLGGPNGIFGLDPIHGLRPPAAHQHRLLLPAAVILLVLTMGVLHLLDASRTGRAWRAVREDPLAASLMTIPVNRVKLMAFAFGAAIAAMAGAVFAAQQTSVFPTDFDTPVSSSSSTPGSSWAARGASPAPSSAAWWSRSRWSSCATPPRPPTCSTG